MQVIRPMYSNPPKHGAEIVTAILSDQQLYSQWKVCVDHCDTPFTVLTASQSCKALALLNAGVPSQPYFPYYAYTSRRDYVQDDSHWHLHTCVSTWAARNVKCGPAQQFIRTCVTLSSNVRSQSAAWQGIIYCSACPYCRKN